MSNYISKNLSDEEIKAYSCGEVYNEQDLSLRGSEPSTISGGLYDKRIFGSSRFCECGTSFSAGHICPICAVHIESPALLRKRFGHINLKYPYLSPYQTPTFVRLFKRIFGPYALGMEEKLTTASSLKKILTIVHRYEFRLEAVEDETPFSIGGRYFKPRIEYAEDNSSLESIGLSGIKLILNAVDMTDDMKELDTILHKVLLISPASTRMYSINTIKGRQLVTLPPRTIDYKCIIYANNHLEDAIKNTETKADAISKIVILQLMIGFVFTNSPITASSKESFVRGSASTTSMKSGRATIISDHNLKVTEVSIPWKLLYHALQSDIRLRLQQKGVTDPDIQYRDHTDEAEKTFQEVLSECACLMVRNPTLHKYNLTAFRPIPNDDEVIHLCPLVCNSFNADFDGDQMAFFLCTDSVKAAEVMERMSAEAHWYYTKTKEAAYTPNREILQGLGIATMLPIIDPEKTYPTMTLEEALEKFDHGEIKTTDLIVIDNKITTVGRANVSKILGCDVDDLIGSDFINADNIAKIMVTIKPQGAEKLSELEKFSVECLKHKGKTTLTLNQLYVDTNSKYSAKFKAILDDESLDLKEKEFQLTKALSEVMSKLIDDIPVPDLRKTIKESNRYKEEQLTSLIGPTIIHNGDSFEVQMDTHLDGMGTKAYIEEAINNRRIWGYKQALVSVGGYNARQLAVLARDLEFDPEPNIKETEDIWLPNDDPKIWGDKSAKEHAKQLENREVHGPAPMEGYVAVRSCIFNGENRVHSNEIDSTIYRDRNGKLHPFNIGIDMLQGFSEPVTQKALGLKHGGSEYNYTEEAFRVKEDCEVLGVEGPYIKVKTGEKVKTYLLPDPEFREVTLEKELKAGDILFDLKKKEHLTAPLAKVSAFIESNVMMDVLKKGVTFCDCYALTEGAIHFIGPGKVEIAGVIHKINPDSIMYFGEGDYVPRFKRICSGVADIKKAHKVLGDYKLTYLVYRNQIRQLAPYVKNLDITEVMFKSSYQFGFSLKKKLNKNTDLIGSLYKGSTKGNKSVLKDFVNKQQMRLYDPNDLLYKLIFSDGLGEVEPRL